jgi:FMN phosphatase YigB (HAD superfamily)
MFNFISNLHEDGFKIALLSNIGSAHAEKLESDYPELFNKIYYKHYSFECGMAKPSKLFFQSFLLQNEDFAGCVYLDDKIENIKMGSSCKFSGILFDLDKFNSKLDLKKELDRIRKRLG